MPPLPPLDVWTLAAAVVLPAGAVLSWRCGWIGRHAFAAAPPRRVSLGLIDIAGAMVIQLTGMIAAGYILQALGLLATDNLPPARIAQRALLGQALTQLPIVLFVLVRTRPQRDGWRELGLLPRRGLWELGVGIVGLLAALLLTLATTILTSWCSRAFVEIPPQVAHPMLEALQQSRQPGALALLFCSAVIVAPILEETIFRGLVQTALREVPGAAERPGAVVFVAAALFSLIHLGMPWQTIPGLLVLGIVLGWLYQRTGSLGPPILVHAGFNALNMLQAYYTS